MNLPGFCIVPLFLTACFATQTITIHERRVRTALTGGQRLENCDDSSVVTRNGNHVQVDLVVDIAKLTFDWLELYRRVYNGKLCGPTIRLKRGDKLDIKLVNKLGPQQGKPIHNQLHSPNTTNIHLHGLHLPNLYPGDDIFQTVGPGKTNNYTYDIDPEQPSGTFFYHAHFHGSTWFQVSSGMSGVLLVEDAIEEMSSELGAVSCPEHCENEIEILIQPTLQFATGNGFIHSNQEVIGDAEMFMVDPDTKKWLEDEETGVNLMTVNGILQPTLQLEAGQIKRIRIVNAGGIDGLELHVENINSSQPQCQIFEIAYDGVYLDKPRRPKLGQTFLTPGSRADLLLRCDTPGVYELKSTALEENRLSFAISRRYNGTLMTINVTQGDLTEPFPEFPTTLPRRQSFNQDLRDVSKSSIGGYFVLELAETFVLNRDKFDHKTDYRYKMEVDTVQEWTLINTVPQFQHPIHIHLNHFQIISYNEYNGPWSFPNSADDSYVFRSPAGEVCTKQHSNFSGNKEEGLTPIEATKIYGEYFGHDVRYRQGGVGTLGYAEVGDWRDVLHVPPMSNITIRFNTHKYTGPVVIHCHVLRHEDFGMLLTAEIVKKGGDLSGARIGSGGACPGSCNEDDTWVPYPDGCGSGYKVKSSMSALFLVAALTSFLHEVA